MSTTLPSPTARRVDGRSPELLAGPSRPTKTSWPRRVGRRVAQALAVLTALTLVAALLQSMAERRDAAAHPAPGDLVELADGRLLHLQVSGARGGGPTVVLEAGAGAFSAGWAWIQPALAEHTAVVSYDRAGLGWSDPRKDGPDADAVVADLHAGLALRGLPGPYILVGHSLGGHYVRAFAAAHPDEVAGVVLVDPSHEHQSAILGSAEDMAPVALALRAAARLGLLRVTNPLAAGVDALPQPQRDVALAHLASTANVRAFGREMTALDQIGARLPSHNGALGDVPLRVLVAGAGARDAEQERLYAEAGKQRASLAGLSSRGRSIRVPEASHVSILTDQHHAEAVTAAILDVLRAVPASTDA